jgi:hypothetical protein
MDDDSLNLLGDSRNREIVKKIMHAIENVRYGSVEVTIHESRVVQIERKEKIRFDKYDQAIEIKRRNKVENKTSPAGPPEAATNG